MCIYAITDWTNDWYEEIQCFHALFTGKIDYKTLEVLDVSDAFHPFACAAKVQSEDSTNKIPWMNSVERKNGWNPWTLK